jgi:CubicO group peptidase (beta-lactamase class C family)
MRSLPRPCWGLVFALCSLWPPPVRAAQSAVQLSAADSIVEAWVADGRIPGAVLRVTRGGTVLLETAHGSAQRYDFGAGQYPESFDPASPAAGLEPLTAPRPMSTRTVFDLASVTKVMATTMAAMLLVDRGQMDLDAPIRRYLPEFSAGPKSTITVQQLLTHRSGLAQWTPVYYAADNPQAAYLHIRAMPLGWPVGEGRHYSDLGFMLLGRIVEEVSGVGLDAFLQDELYGPLGLARTGFAPLRGASVQPDDRRDFAATSHGNPFERRMVYDPEFGYRIDGDPRSWDGWRHYTLSGEVNDGNAHHAFQGVAGHAGLFSNASELSVLVELLLAGGKDRGRRYIDDEVVSRFLRPAMDGQALGWQIPEFAPNGSFYHTGFTGTFVLGVPETGLAIVLLTNRQNGGVLGDGRYIDVAPLQRAVVEALTR